MTLSFTDAGDGLPVIALHGVGSGKEGFANQVDPITSAGFRFIAMDAPGFGETPLPRESGFDQHVASLLRLMDQLSLKEAVLLGHSLGGMTAQELMASHPDRVAGLILSATSPAFGKPDGDFQKRFLADRMKPFDDGMDMATFASKFAPRLVGSNASSDAIEEVAAVMSGVSIEAYKRAMHTIVTFDQRQNLASIDVPTLLIAGEEDKNSPAPMMAKMATKIEGAHFVELPKTGHMAPVENATEFNHHTLKFLTETF